MVPGRVALKFIEENALLLRVGPQVRTCLHATLWHIFVKLRFIYLLLGAWS